MPEFTRDDEHSLDFLRTKKELGKIHTEEVRILQQLEQKYDTFINEGLGKLSRMAPRRTPRQLRLRHLLISWPVLFLMLFCFLTVLYLLQFRENGRERRLFLIRWHLYLIGLLLALVTLVGFTLVRERLILKKILLGSCVLIPVLLGMLTLVTFFRSRANEFGRWDGCLFSFCWVGDGLIVGELAALLFLH
ncbi:hypothetical protein TraAM80_07897 [Trypanosoma rangeli]|uniref:Uncharacterized protein n=1 Tax=Trypanosoma rangeli TaxID=5698 RepID=A0A422N388_TRYRA|nr:uncharacterized protein TraAM80_07897 [Trypanosoma rangeli]RNE99956.1 hypothetical protein TraAM80_07897 [Trypanosoma rangeli]|eukprot:RNE99956.1 hypothetical protein TraAM80_07897 [Trypanosoma rangeli]